MPESLLKLLFFTYLMIQARYPNKLYLTGIDSHFQIIRQFVLLCSSYCNNFNSVEIHITLIYEEWVVCANRY